MGPALLPATISIAPNSDWAPNISDYTCLFNFHYFGLFSPYFKFNRKFVKTIFELWPRRKVLDLQYSQRTDATESTSWLEKKT